MKMFQFDLTERKVLADGSVIRTGKIFEAGVWPDKNFALSEAEMDSAIEKFSPINLNDDHDPFSIFNGFLGSLQEIWRVGKDLFGRIVIPEWLDKIIRPGEPLKVSTEWNSDKELVGLAVTGFPRIEDAAMFAAFTNHVFARQDTPHGKGALQYIHDMAARAGALCFQQKTEMTSTHERTAFQRIHDMAVEHGATCLEASDHSYYSNAKPAEAGRREKQMLHAFTAAFAGKGLPIAQFTALSEDAKPETVAATAAAVAFEFANELARQARENDPILAAFKQAGIETAEAVKESLEMAEYGRGLLAQKRETVKALATVIFKENAQVHDPIIDSANFSMLEGMEASFKQIAVSMGLTGKDGAQAADRQTAPLEIATDSQFNAQKNAPDEAARRMAERARKKVEGKA